MSKNGKKPSGKASMSQPKKAASKRTSARAATRPSKPGRKPTTPKNAKPTPKAVAPQKAGRPTATPLPSEVRKPAPAPVTRQANPIFQKQRDAIPTEARKAKADQSKVNARRTSESGRQPVKPIAATEAKPALSQPKAPAPSASVQLPAHSPKSEGVAKPAIIQNPMPSPKVSASARPAPVPEKSVTPVKPPEQKPIAAYFRSANEAKPQAEKRKPLQAGTPARAYVAQSSERPLSPAPVVAQPKAPVVARVVARVSPTPVAAVKPETPAAPKVPSFLIQAEKPVDVPKRPAPEPRQRRSIVRKNKSVSVKAPASAEPQPIRPGEPVLPFSGPQFVRGPEPIPQGEIDRGKPIPESYAVDRLVAIVRDPHWVFCYWELTGDLLNRIRGTRGSDFVDSAAWTLRLHRYAEEMAVDVQIDPRVGNWYIHVGQPGEYQLELGLLSREGEYLTLLASQVIITPSDRPSDITDEEWQLLKEREEELYQRLLKELGLTADARKRGVSGFVGASGVPSSWPAASWRLPGSFLGASGGQSGAGLGGSSGSAWGAVGVSSGVGWSGVLGLSSALGASESGRPLLPAEWVSSFLGASGRPTSMGSGGLMDVGWILGADGRHEVVMLRPGEAGGPNWHLQPYLPGQVDTSGFSVKLPRVVHGVPHPAPSWPQPSGASGASVTTTAGQVSSAIVPWAHPEPVKLTVGSEEEDGAGGGESAEKTAKTKRRNGNNRRGSATVKPRDKKNR